MQNRILLFLGLSLCLFSCSKSSSSSSSGTAENTITATIDGTDQTFNVTAQAIAENTSGSYSLSILGLHDQSVNLQAMTIVISGFVPVTPGSFTATSTGTQDGAGIFFVQNSNEYEQDNDTPDQPIVTITSISSTSVQGTFQGKLVLQAGASGAASKTITNGKFNVKIKQ